MKSYHTKTKRPTRAYIRALSDLYAPTLKAGTARCQCPSCGETSSSVRAFDDHRVGPHGDRGCLPGICTSDGHSEAGPGLIATKMLAPLKDEARKRQGHGTTAPGKRSVLNPDKAIRATVAAADSVSGVVVDMSRARDRRVYRLIEAGHSVSDCGRDYGHELCPRCLGVEGQHAHCRECGKPGCSCHSETEA